MLIGPTNTAGPTLHIHRETHTKDQVTRTFAGSSTQCECSASRPRGTNAHLHGQRLHEVCAPSHVPTCAWSALLEYVSALRMLTIARVSGSNAVFRAHDRDQIS